MANKIDMDFMSKALEQAKEAKQNGELPFGAVIVCDGVVISAGQCREQKEKSVLAHAELEAVGKACRTLATNRLEECTIYCTNEPCPMCSAAIFQAKIATVVIGASRKDIPSLRPRTIDIQKLADDSGYPITITCGVMRQDVLRLHK
nr:Cytidine and deoxycytidylate deaminase zinc-binding region [uncultured bacterium]